MNRTERRTTPSARPQFWRVALRTCVIAGSTNLLFLLIFLTVGSPILAWVSVGSMTVYAIAYWAIRQRKNKLGVGLIWSEVVLHAALGILLIGWGSGFHYYLLVFIPALAVTLKRSKAIAALLVLWVLYTGLFVMSELIPPLQPLVSRAALDGVNLFNLTVVFAMFSYLALFYIETVIEGQRALRKLASTDMLTGLKNRRHMTEVGEAEISRAERFAMPLSVLLIDADHFKLINDIFSHQKGDEVLCCLTKLLRAELRQHDVIGRWGGEEFLVLLPNTALENAQLLAERIRSTVKDFRWQELLKDELAVSISIGVTQLLPNETLNRLINRADKALHSSKANGRNRVTAVAA